MTQSMDFKSKTLGVNAPNSAVANELLIVHYLSLRARNMLAASCGYYFTVMAIIFSMSYTANASAAAPCLASASTASEQG